MRFIKKFRNRVEELGTRTAVLLVLWRVLHAISKSNKLIHYHLVAQPVVGRRLPAHRGKSIEIQRLPSRDERLHALDLVDDVLAYREAQDAVCFAAFKENRIIGCLWVCPGPYEEDEVRCRFIPLPAGKAVWDYGVYVLPAYRSSPAFARLWDEANAYLREQGVQWALSRILAYNAQSLRSHRGLGSRTLGTATFLVLGSVQLTFCSLSPRIHLSFSHANRPKIAVRSPNGSPGAEAAATAEVKAI